MTPTHIAWAALTALGLTAAGFFAARTAVGWCLSRVETGGGR